MKKFAFLLIAMTSPYVLASDWQVLTAGDNVSVLIDRSSIAERGKFRKGWVIYSYSKEKPGNATTQFRPYRSVKSLEYVSCSERTSATIQNIYHQSLADTGELLGTFSIPVEKAQFDDVAPDTLGEGTLNYICSFPIKGRN